MGTENNSGANIEKSDGAEISGARDGSTIHNESIIDNPAALQTWKDAQAPPTRSTNGPDIGLGGFGSSGVGRLLQREKSKDEVLAENTKSPETLAKLAKSDNLVVRMAVTRNSFTEQKVYEGLTTDKDELVRQAAAGASRPMSEDLQMKFAQDKDTDVRYAIAKRTDATEKVLDKLADDKDWTIRDGVAENANTSPTRLAQMLNDPEPRVVKSAMNNPHTPKEAIVAAQKAAAEKTAQEAAQKAWKPKDDYKSFEELKQDVMQNGSFEMQAALTSLEQGFPNAQVLQALAGQAIDSMTPAARELVTELKDLLRLGKQK